MGIISEGIELLGLANKGVNVDLYTKLGKYVEETQQLYAERDKLANENHDLREQLRFKGTVRRIWGYTFVDGETEPVCSRCAEVDNRPVHFTVSTLGTMMNRLICPQCKIDGGRAINRLGAEKQEQEGGRIR